MEKKYVVKDFEAQTYYGGESFGFADVVYYAEYFDTMEDAENFIKRENGRFQIEVVQIEVVYVV